MRSLPSLTSIGLAVAALSHGVVAAGPPAHRVVQVGISLDSPAAAASRHAPAMIAEANAIWRPYGVAIVLLEQRDAPDIAATDVQLTLRFAPAAKRPAARTARGLGGIWFHESGAPTQALTIDADVVAATVREAGLNGRSIDQYPPALNEQLVRRALGRVLAHEIGHFLLASPTHSRTGLMRPSFNGRMLGAFDRLAFQLDSVALPRLQAQLARYDALQRPLAAAKDEPR